MAPERSRLAPLERGRKAIQPAKRAPNGLACPPGSRSLFVSNATATAPLQVILHLQEQLFRVGDPQLRAAWQVVLQHPSRTSRDLIAVQQSLRLEKFLHIPDEGL